MEKLIAAEIDTIFILWNGKVKLEDYEFVAIDDPRYPALQTEIATDFLPEKRQTDFCLCYRRKGSKYVEVK